MSELPSYSLPEATGYLDIRTGELSRGVHITPIGLETSLPLDPLVLRAGSDPKMDKKIAGFEQRHSGGYILVESTDVVVPSPPPKPYQWHPTQLQSAHINPSDLVDNGVTPQRARLTVRALRRVGVVTFSDILAVGGDNLMGPVFEAMGSSERPLRHDELRYLACSLYYRSGHSLMQETPKPEDWLNYYTDISLGSVALGFLRAPHLSGIHRLLTTPLLGTLSRIGIAQRLSEARLFEMQDEDLEPTKRAMMAQRMRLVLTQGLQEVVVAPFERAKSEREYDIR